MYDLLPAFRTERLFRESSFEEPYPDLEAEADRLNQYVRSCDTDAIMNLWMEFQGKYDVDQIDWLIEHVEDEELYDEWLESLTLAEREIILTMRAYANHKFLWSTVLLLPIEHYEKYTEQICDADEESASIAPLLSSEQRMALVKILRTKNGSRFVAEWDPIDSVD